MKLGVVGLPNVGKSTLFNALTKAGAQSANYPFCTIEPNVGIVTVHDERIDFLAKHFQAKSVVNATIEFVDIAGLVKGAASGEGLGNKFLASIRESDAIVHVVRTFEKGDIIHVDGSVDPVRDINTINLELMLADIDSVTKRIEKTTKQLKADKKYQEEIDLLVKIKGALEQGKNASTVLVDDKEREMSKGFFLLTTKPVIYCANLNEDDIANGGKDNAHFRRVQEFAKQEGNGVVAICAKIEEELSMIDDESERTELMQMYGIDTSGLDRLIKVSYDLLGLISFLTAGVPEVRAWTIKGGTRAPGAAGKIHSDFERGFIRAEVVSFDDFVASGGFAKAKESGKVREQGKDYVVKDGDIIHFRFNV